MFREIGSEFNLSSNSETKNEESKFLADKNYCDYTFTRSGREAIGYILDELKPKTRIALLPAYICESMLEPFLVRGYDVIYFDIDINFSPVLSDVKSGMLKKPDVLLIMNWFGINCNDELVLLVRENSRDIVTIADRTHDFFNDEIYMNTDYAIASLRKWFPIPDGAIAINCKNKFENKLIFNDNEFYNKRKQAMLLKNEYLILGQQSIKNEYRVLLAEAEKSLQTKTPVGMSSYSNSLINNMNFIYMKKKRYENYYALDCMINKNYVQPMINTLQKNSDSLFCYPIIAYSKRDDLQKWLSDRGVYCPVLWPLPKEIYSKYEVPAYFSDNMLSVPCDQRYTTEDMEYVAEAINTFFQEGK